MTDTLSRLAAIIHDQLSDVPPITSASARLDRDLEIDSLDLIGIVMEVEDAFDVELDDDAIDGCETVGDLVKLIDAAVAGRVAA